jgi:acetate kinase
MYVHRLRKYIGAYFFALSGAQAFVFTGGVGENSWELREMIISGWDSLGFVLDKEANRIAVNGRSGMISTETSKVKIFVVRTDEERMIARLAFGLTGHDLK